MGRYTFRGQDINTGKWVYGHFYTNYKDSFVGEEDAYYINGTEVKCHTVGQCTGLKDGRGIDIYEGDIVQGREYKALIQWDKSKAAFEMYLISHGKISDWSYLLSPEIVSNLCVIGNMHENKICDY